MFYTLYLQPLHPWVRIIFHLNTVMNLWHYTVMRAVRTDAWRDRLQWTGERILVLLGILNIHTCFGPRNARILIKIDKIHKLKDEIISLSLTFQEEEKLVKFSDNVIKRYFVYFNFSSITIYIKVCHWYGYYTIKQKRCYRIALSPCRFHLWFYMV